jgi:hypothetical protein
MDEAERAPTPVRLVRQVKQFASYMPSGERPSSTPVRLARQVKEFGG